MYLRVIKDKEQIKNEQEFSTTLCTLSFCLVKALYFAGKGTEMIAIRADFSKGFGVVCHEKLLIYRKQKSLQHLDKGDTRVGFTEIKIKFWKTVT